MNSVGGTVGLVLEGGGMRGIFTAGVLDYFADRGLQFPYHIGVSAGACMAISYISSQRGRNKKVNIDFAGDPRYLSWGKYLRERRELFGMDFIFEEIPRRLVPFDFEAYQNSPCEFVVGTTDMETGRPVYYTKSSGALKDDLLTVLRASSSLPFFAPIVEYGGRKLMDGGIADPIPIRKAEQDGCSRTVLILTRNQGYVKGKNRLRWLLERKFASYPEFVQVMMRRHEIYNEAVAYAEKREREGAAFLIRPNRPLSVGRTEQNKQKLEALYRQGYEEAEQIYPRLMEWMHNAK